MKNDLKRCENLSYSNLLSTYLLSNVLFIVMIRNKFEIKRDDKRSE